MKNGSYKILPFEQASVNFTQIKKHLGLNEQYQCNLVSYSKTKKKDENHNTRYELTKEDTKKAEDGKIFEAKAFHTLRKAYKEAELEPQWQQDKQNRERLDTIGKVLTTYRDDSSIKEQLQEAGIEAEVIEAVLDCEFSTYHHLSLKVLHKILPFMEKQGLTYDKACQETGYHHSVKPQNRNKTGKIPAPDKNQIRNPVVLRSLNQARKLINAIIKEYGKPAAIHIEMGRELNKPYKERKEIEQGQKEFRQQKDEAIQKYQEHFNTAPQKDDLSKYRLYREQDGKCAYSQKAIDLKRLPETGYVQVDHILPYSRSYDNSQNNKALVLIHENQNKGNHTPFEYMGKDEQSERWHNFENWVKSNPKIRQAKRWRYLCKDFGEGSKDFSERNLKDTQYVGRVLKEMIEQNIIWAGEKPDGKQDRCVVLSGGVTGLMRTRWGFNKNRSDGDLHHAMDAAVIAATNRSMIKRIAEYSKRDELKCVRNNYSDTETGEIFDIARLRQLDNYFPRPWDNFRNDVLTRLEQVRVSRALSRRKLGAAHQETIRARVTVSDVHQLINDKGLPVYYSALKTPIDKLKLNDIDNIAGINDKRNQGLRQALEKWLTNKANRDAKHKQEKEDLKKQHKAEWDDLKSSSSSGKSKPSQDKSDALKKQQSRNHDLLDQQQLKESTLYMPAGKKDKQGPPIHHVKLLNKKEGKNGIPVRSGIANKDSMIRLDVFQDNKGKHYGVPIYVSYRVRDTLPKKAEPSRKIMDESYQFLFSLHKNDWVKLTKSNKQTIAGYYQTFDIAGGKINIYEHDRNPQKGTDKNKSENEIKNPGLHRSLGIKTAQLQKYHVDILGNLYKAKPEQRQPLRKGQTI